MDTLIILAHPNLATSRINKAWADAGKKEKGIALHDLYAHYGESNRIDISSEQNLLLKHNTIIFQFPFYWFGVPPLLKKWFDDVLLPGFAYGNTEEERKLSGKKFGLAVSAGIREEDYRPDGRYLYTMETLLSPLRTMISYIDGINVPPFILYGAEYNPGQDEIEKSAEAYLQYIRNIQ